MATTKNMFKGSKAQISLAASKRPMWLASQRGKVQDEVVMRRSNQVGLHKPRKGV